MATIGGIRAARAHQVIRIDVAWFAVEPLDMRAGVDKALARVVNVFGEARTHQAYLFINKRANRRKVKTLPSSRLSEKTALESKI
jgi:hypothetical protein